MNIYFNNKIIETIFVITASTVLAIFGVYYWPFIIIFYPILFIVIGTRQGIIYGITTLAISSLSIGFMLDVMSGIFMFIAYAPLSIAIIYTIKNRKRPIEVLFISTLFFLLSSMAIMIIMGDITGSSIISELKDIFNQTMEMQIGVMEENQLTNFEIFQIRSRAESGFRIFLNTIPSVMVIASLFISYVNYLVSSLFLRKIGYGVVFIPKFSRFKLPRNIIAGIGIMFITTLLLSSFEIFYMEAVWSSLKILGFLAFFLQGLSVVDYKLLQRKINIVFRLFIIAIMIILSPLISGVIAIIGVLDSVFDFRKFRKTV